MKLRIILNFDEYFKFLEEYFLLFKPNLSKRKKITGTQFKL